MSILPQSTVLQLAYIPSWHFDVNTLKGPVQGLPGPLCLENEKKNHHKPQMKQPMKKGNAAPGKQNTDISHSFPTSQAVIQIRFKRTSTEMLLNEKRTRKEREKSQIIT